MDKEQLIKKNCNTGEYSNLYPITSLEAVIDLKTGKNIAKTIESYNHIFLPFTENSRAITRCQIPQELRRKGLWITYISCKDNVITEWYDGNTFDDTSWGNSNNWHEYLDDSYIKEIVDKILSWYKA